MGLRMQGKLLVVIVTLGLLISLGWPLVAPSAAEAVADPTSNDSPVNFTPKVNYIGAVVGVVVGFLALLFLTLRAASMTVKRRDERASAIDHVGFTVADLERSRDFYTKALGFRVTGEGFSKEHDRPLLFLGTRSKEGQVMLRQFFPGERTELKHLKKAANLASFVDHVSFSLPSLSDLKALWRELNEEAPHKIQSVVTHGSKVSVYCYDPDDNLVEFCCETGLHTRGPGSQTVDLSWPDKEILAVALRVSREPLSKSKIRNGETGPRIVDTAQN